jgi:dGTPase
MAPVRRSEALVGELFDTYTAGAPMPGRWRDGFIAAPDERAAVRVVCDFIAGMTDRYALAEHAKHFASTPALQ